MTDIILSNARLIDPETGFDAPGALLIRDGMIADIAQGAPCPMRQRVRRSLIAAVIHLPPVSWICGSLWGSLASGIRKAIVQLVRPLLQAV